jgi:hypothetical protein
MSRRNCDNYVCEECELHTELTEKLKLFMQENDIETTERVLELGRINGKLTQLGRKSNRWQYVKSVDDDDWSIVPKYTKEQSCMMNFYNPDGIYDE